MTTYLSNSSLPTVNSNFKGNIKINGRFEAEEAPAEKPSFLKVLRWQLTPNPQRNEKKKENFKLPVIPNKTFMLIEEDIIVWLGHASFFIRINGVPFITDPCLFDLPFIKRQAPLPCHADQLHHIQYMLLSHGHRDHFDANSVKKVISQNPEIELLMPLENSSLLGKQKSSVKHQEAGWYQEYALAENVQVIFLPAKHWSRRGLTDYNKTLWGSFLLKWNDKKIYFAGDSGYGSHFQKIRELLGDIDICIMPVGAYKPNFMMKEAHMNPEEAVQAFHDLGGKTFIPMHFGTYDLSDEPLGEPLRILHNLEKSDKINGAFKALAVGETYYLD